MESSAAGGHTPPRPSASSGGASPPAPPAPPPPPRGWLSGLVSGAGRILAAVLGPEPESSASVSGSGSIASATASDGGSPSASCSPAWCQLPGPRGEGHNGDTGNGNSPLFPVRNDQLNQGEKETILKDYAGSLAIISEIEPKDAIMQLLMQETYSRSECSKFIRIIQERVLDSDSGDMDAGGFALTSARKAGRQAVDGYSSFSPNEPSPATSSLQMHRCDNSAAVGTIPKLTHTDQNPFIQNAKSIHPVLKRNYSVREDDYEEVRRVRPKINGNPLNMSKFKQVDIIRSHSAANSREELPDPNASRDEKELLTDAIEANNLAYPNIVSKVESADEILDVPNKPSAVTPQRIDSSFSQAGRNQKGFGATTLNQCSSEELKKGFPLKVEPLNVFIPFEQQMMDLSHQKQEHAVCDDSCSLSKLMLKEDVEAAPRLPMSLQLQNGSKNRRKRQSNPQKTTPTPTRSPAKGPRRKNDIIVKSEMDLLEQSKLVLTEQGPELGDVPVKRPVGRPRKARNGPSTDDPSTPAS